MADHLLLILLALLLVGVNGFFVAAEFGLVKLRQTRLKAIAKVYGLRGRLLVKVHAQLDAYLSACQLGITLASLGLGWIGEPAFAGLLVPVLNLAGVEAPEVVHGIAFVAAFVAISFLHIVVGELAPKSMAIRQAEKVAIWTAPPLFGFYWLMYPAIRFLNGSANWVLARVGLGGVPGHEAHYSADELKLILQGGGAPGAFTRDEWQVLAHTLDFSDLEVADLMRPFHEMVALSATHTLEENLDIMARQRYSRYPYLDTAGEVCGLIHLKSLFLAQAREGGLKNLDHFVTPVQRVPPDLPALELFRLFRQGAPHFVLVGRRGVRPMGFITLDNLLGALVGEIRDEFRPAGQEWTRLDDGTLIGKGSLPIFSLERALGIDIEHGEADSVGGLVLWKLGDLPREGDRIAFNGFDVVIKKMAGPRIAFLRVLPKDGGAASSH